MIKRPSRKKLPQDLLEKAVDMYNKPYRPLVEDEAFYKIPFFPRAYKSQYGRIIQLDKRTGKPILLSPCYNLNTGYTILSMYDYKGNKTTHGIHKWGAEMWCCNYPTFLDDCEDISDNDKIVEYHHLLKVKENGKLQPVSTNFVDNILPVYSRYHSSIENIKSIRYLAENGKYKYCDIRQFNSIADYYYISLRTLYELIKGNPTTIDNGIEYYKLSDNKIVLITKYNSKSENSTKAS